MSCFNSPEGNRDAVGEQALGMLLSLMNNLNRADRQVRNGEWIREENRGFEIKGKTIAIIGYGNMGSSFARKLKGFEANVIAYDKYKQNYSQKWHLYTRESHLERNYPKVLIPMTANDVYASVTLNDFYYCDNF